MQIRGNHRNGREGAHVALRIQIHEPAVHEISDTMALPSLDQGLGEYKMEEGAGQCCDGHLHSEILEQCYLHHLDRYDRDWR